MDEKIERRRSLPISELIHCRGTDVERSHTPEGRARAARPSGDPPDPYGVVVDSVKVSVLLYAPVRSASVDLTSWLYSMVTASLDTGPFHVSRFSGEALEPTLLYAVPVLAALRARACSGSGRMNEPLTRWPVPTEDGSATLSNASPAVEVTVAGVDAKYVFVTPGVKAPNAPGAPRESESFAGTLPPTVPSPEVALIGTSNAWTSFCALTNEIRIDGLPLDSRAAAAAESGSESDLLPGVIVNACWARMPPIMSGAHGGVEPSAALQAERP